MDQALADAVNRPWFSRSPTPGWPLELTDPVVTSARRQKGRALRDPDLASPPSFLNPNVFQTSTVLLNRLRPVDLATKICCLRPRCDYIRCATGSPRKRQHTIGGTPWQREDTNG